MYKPRAAPVVAPEAAPEVAPEVVTQTPPPSDRFAVLYRKKSTKKHKVWEGDAIATLKNDLYIIKDGTKTLGAVAAAKFNLGEFACGSYEFEVEGPAAQPAPAASKQQKSSEKKTPSSSPLFVEPFRVPSAGADRRSLAPVPVCAAVPTVTKLKQKTTKLSQPPAQPLFTPFEPVAKKQKLPKKWEIAPELAGKLRPHQTQAVEFLHACISGKRHCYGNGAILADDMGLGKTLSSITLVYSLLQAQAIETVLIACPASLVKNWRNEFRKWLPKEAIGVFALLPGEDPSVFCRSSLKRTFSVLVTGYERVRSIVPQVQAGFGQFDLVICDEGHRLKSQDSKTLASLEEVAGDKRIILSGTPIQNNLEEFRVMSNFVNPGIFKSASKFSRNFSEAILKSRASDSSTPDRELGLEKIKELSELAQEFVLRRDASVLAGHLTVPKQEILLFCKPLKQQILAYQQELQQTHFWESESAQSLALISRLRRISTSAHDPPTLKGNFKQQLATMAPLDGSNKLRVLQDMLSALSGSTSEKAVIVSGFLETLDLVQQLCAKLNFSWVRLDGSTPQTQRQGIVDLFNKADQERAFVFLLSAKSGGTGLNLVGASRLFMMDCDWNPSTDLQAMARVHRDGQLRPTFIYRLLSTGTIDEKILQRQISKQGVSESLFDACSDGDKFTREQLREIFAFRECVKCDTVDNGHDLDYAEFEEEEEEELVLAAAKRTGLVTCVLRKK